MSRALTTSDIAEKNKREELIQWMADKDWIVLPDPPSFSHKRGDMRKQRPTKGLYGYT